MTSEKLKAFLVGRWPSGAPLALSPDQDNPELAKDESNNNNFDYDKDQDGFKTPVISHIRKVNPRNQSTNEGIAAKTLTFSILRRGIPFGQPLDMSKPDPIKGDRGLLFLCYQTSIENQFELLVTKWMNSSRSPTNAPSPLNNKQSGFDILVGQNKQDWIKPVRRHDGQDEMGKGRERFGLIERSINNQSEEAQIFTKGLNLLDWVIPTGGGYFFSPSISSLKSFFGSN
jgi:Dyp-type peroxidase family